MLFILIVIIV